MSRKPEPSGSPERPGERRHVWDDPKNVQILIWVFWFCCAVVFALDFVFNRYASFEHGELPIEQMVGFYSIYGFVACVLLVLIAKQMRKVLMRDEDYYEHHERRSGSLLPRRGDDGGR